ncbi:arylsulfatase : Sulfatase family protein OS=Rhodopirellula europaea SH398 GN=RESH_04009 PE=4 SV=1: Sulfatase [Gemmata massiliana]|uniref:Sulfatase N-terminal domain-containing protein n=1 Tax=Gemmata massiliana TaxID=1210884 RepID=A0A6P2DM10_9BACT|nr:arylsulfatase [Gemmata massiliana]VTS01777.1 arylsulfatase : Sulfatase family protein OS=Rhodopirellula europaea SH398 GN=RESH_04009 PE=4 SV=1: Sulfatase [Gemmata massiliana]
MRTRTVLTAAALVAVGALFGWVTASGRLVDTFAQNKQAEPQPAPGPDRSKLPIPLSPFDGKIGKTYKESEAAWQKPPAPPEGAPNVVVILLDDVGFGQTSTFGGLIPTPNLDKLAAQGLKYNRFHTTAVCGPTRAALLTGRNHHECGNGFLMEWATGFPNYSTMIPKSTATVGEVLRDNGYATWWFGKNHNTPDWETTVAGPFDRWPTGMGFDYFYGFNAGETHQYYPVAFENTTPVEPNKSPEAGYHFMTDMTDRAVARMKSSKSVAPGKPFFMYFAPGAMHAPHHVTAEWRKKFAGKFDMGWEKYRETVYKNQLDKGIIPAGTKLTPRPDWVPAWETVDDQKKKLYTALMENFAGYFAFTDHEVGRLLDAVKELPDADNTLVMYIVGDNGASAEGGPDGTLDEIKNLNGIPTDIKDTLANLNKLGGPESEPHYPVGWAWAGNTPFQWTKQVASHLGGSRNPMVVSWPAKIKPDDKPRDAFLHVVDVLPTILEAAKVPMPDTVNGIKQKPLAGKSFLGSFTDPSFKGRTEQYFEILSNRSIYVDGWKANAQHTLPWRQDLAPGNWDKDKWELYHLDEDFSEANDLAQKMPDKLKELKAQFDAAAQKHDVYPLDDRGAARLTSPKPPVPGTLPGVKTFTYYPGATRIAENAAPPMKNRSWTLTAKVRTEGEKTEGVILGFGGVAAGLSLYLDKGVPVFDYNFFEKHTVVKGKEIVAAGEATVEVVFDYQGEKPGGPAAITLKVNGKSVAEGKIPITVAGRFGIDTFGVGEDTGQPVTNAYKSPFKFNGTIEKVTITVK